MRVKLLILLAVSMMLFSCKAEKKVKSKTQGSSFEKPEPPGPGDLYPNQAILTLEITKILETSVLTNYVSTEKQSFGFSTNLLSGQEVEITDVPDDLMVLGAVGKWVVEFTDVGETPVFLFVRTAD